MIKNVNKTTAGLNSERGVVLIIVLILSGIALAVMTALIYMITAGTQISGMEKRYKTAKEAGSGGWQIMSDIIGDRANDTSSLLNTLNTTFGMNASIVTASTCTGKYAGQLYQSFQTKVLAGTSAWSGSCNKIVNIDPNDSSTYDVKFELGSGQKYVVYAKIVNTVTGNTGGKVGGGSDLSDSGGVVNSNSGGLTMAVPYLYTVEVHAENKDNSSEKSKFSVLYEF